jgi:hypothetical protein
MTVVFALLLAPAMALGQTFVQIVGNTPSTATAVTFTTAENAGDFNVVVVGWSDETASVMSVTDSNSNNYILAGTSGGETQSIAMYYAKNISISTTATPTVTVVFSNPNEVADVRALEYTGFNSSALTVDNWIGNAGSGSLGSSGTVATSQPGDLLVGGGTASYSFATGGLPAYMTARGGGLDTFGNVTMDSNGPVVAAPPYQASANVLQGAWVMQVVGFSLTGITTNPPTVASITPTGGAVSGGDAVTITGTNFANGSIAFFGDAPTAISLVNCVVTSPTTMTCNTPADNEGPKDLTVVNVDGKTSATLMGAFTYAIDNPSISSISPVSSTTNGGSTITITGTNFEAEANVTVGGSLAPQGGSGLFGDNVKVLSSTTITITSPAFSTGPEDVTVNNPDGGSAVDPGALTYALGTGPINYIQRGDAASGRFSTTTVPIPMTNDQGKGDLNLVIVGWSNTSSLVSSVTDTEGNTYQQALPTVSGAGLSQVVYYAKNIKGDGNSATPNTITVNMSADTPSVDIRVLEYSGLDPNNPLDQGVSNAGSGSPADSGACLTTSAVELIVAGTTVSSEVTAAGQNFTTVDYTVEGDNVEHQLTSAVGSCEAQTVVAGGNWVTQSVSFKAGAGAGAGYTLTADPPTSDSVTAGSNASYALTLAAQGAFSSPVTLSCSGLPTGATCGFAPSPVTPGSSTADTLTISTTGSTPAGISTVTVTGTPAPNQTATVTLTVTANTAPGFTVAATALSPATVSPGVSATSTITITPVNGFTGSVAFSCSSITGGGTPAPTCSFSTVTNGSSTLTVSTTANSASISPRSTGLFYALLLPIGGMTLLGAGFSSRRKMLVGILLVCMLIAGFIFMTACSSSSGSSTTTPPPGGGTPAGTYAITVSGTATGATTQTQALTLIVN